MPVKSNGHYLFDTNADLADHLARTQETGTFHFEYERETFIVKLGEAADDPEEWYQGRGKTLGEAIENLIDSMIKESYDSANEVS